MTEEVTQSEDTLVHLDAEDNLSALQTYLLDCIPLLQHMHVNVESVDRNALRVAAPLQPNSNHIGTAFGGSLHSMGTVSAWGLLWILLRDQADVHLVIRDSHMRYLQPARGALTSTCLVPNPGLINQFMRNIARRNKSAIELRTTVESDGEVCAEFEGTFVAIRNKS